MSDPLVVWRGRLSVRTWGTWSRGFEAFCEFVGLNPTQLVEFQRANPVSFRFVDAAFEWLEGRDLRYNTMNTQFTMVKSFFRANRCPLPSDGRRFRSSKAPIVGKLTVDGFRKIVLSCNPTYRAIFMMMFQGGMGSMGLLYVNKNFADLVFDEVRKGARFIRFDLPGRKRNRNVRPYFTYVGGDSIDCLKRVFHSRGWRRDSVLFRNDFGHPINLPNIQQYFRKHAIRAGLIKAKTPKCLLCGGETVRRQVMRKGVHQIKYFCVSCPGEFRFGDFGLPIGKVSSIRYGINPHELRDLFLTEWHRSGADLDVGNAFMGHTVDPLGYDKITHDPSFALKEYRKALPFLNILSEDPRVVERSEVDDELVRLREKQSEMEKQIADLKKFAFKA